MLFEQGDPEENESDRFWNRSADPTFPFNGTLNFCGFGAQWGNGRRYIVAP